MAASGRVLMGLKSHLHIFLLRINFAISAPLDELKINKLGASKQNKK